MVTNIDRLSICPPLGPRKSKPIAATCRLAPDFGDSHDASRRPTVPIENNAGASTSYRLLIFHGESIRTFTLTGTEWVIGRANDCDITLPDQTVSRKHLRLERRDEEFLFKDLGGANPVLLNGRPMRQGVFPLNQTMVIGLTRITLDRRVSRVRVVADLGQTQVVAREVLDRELAVSPTPAPLEPDEVTRLLESLEWPLADLGSLQEVAEPLLDMALNLTGRRRGTLGRFQPSGGFECLATMDHSDQERELHVPEQLLREARVADQAFLVTVHLRGALVERLVIPFGQGPAGVIVVEEARPQAPKGQEVLRMARAIGSVTWQRLQETQNRLELRSELDRLRFQGTAAQATILASSRLQQLRPQVRTAAAQDTPVLLLGEDGTEREELAHYLHSQSQRTTSKFVSFYATMVAPHRVEDELFGSGNGHGGAIARAQGGTLYIDHPELLPEVVQGRLATVLQTRRLDANTAIDVRLVAGAAFTEPGAESRLHPALAQLLGGTCFGIPPLRDDPRDVLSLAELILSEMGPLPDGRPRMLSEGAKRLLTVYPWPGNLTELRAQLEAAAARAGAQPIAPRHLPDHLQEGAPAAPIGVPTLEDIERKHIAEVLARVDHNRQRAAKLLGIAQSTLFEKIKRYRLDTLRGKNDGKRNGEPPARDAGSGPGGPAGPTRR
ncbi:MAG: sigma 54-interacting transcriptional regulator [Planctomycetes bacterium]|nr:sigma 54-interacting transcriptional regulator [Planctomycetota bacterium]